MRESLHRWFRLHYLGVTTTLLVAVFVLVLAAPRIVISVPSGHTAVLWRRFFGGTDVNYRAHEGVNLYFPWDRVTLYDLRLCNFSDKYDILAQDGLRIEVDVLVRFRPNAARIGALHRFIGPKFVERLIAPQVGASTRERVSKFTPQELFALKREQVQQEILANLRERLQFVDDGDANGEPLLLVHDLLIRSVGLPPDVQAAIELKIIQEQRDRQYVSILGQERQEAERKRIEAQGIKDFQSIVNNSITPQYLSWKGIDATLKLAESPNAKVVIVGGQGGLPIILGDEFARAAAPASAPVSPSVARRGPMSSNASTMSSGVAVPISPSDRSMLPATRAGSGLPSGATAPDSAGEPKPGFSGNR